MDELIEQSISDPWGRLLINYALISGAQNIYLFLLVAARLSGLILVVTRLTTATIPYSICAALVVLLGLVVTPTLSQIPPHAQHLLLSTGQTPTAPEPPATVTDLCLAVSSEAGLGALLGLGIVTVLSGLKLAGEWFDRHSGLNLGSVLNPDWTGAGTSFGSLAQWMAVAALLLLESSGGRWSFVQCLLRSFQSIPVGSAGWSFVSAEFLNRVAQECLIVGVRIAIPFVASMMLVDVALAFASRGTTPAENSACLGIRAGVGSIVLALTVTTIPDAISLSVISAIQLIGDFH